LLRPIHGGEGFTACTFVASDELARPGFLVANETRPSFEPLVTARAVILPGNTEAKHTQGCGRTHGAPGLQDRILSFASLGERTSSLHVGAM